MQPIGFSAGFAHCVHTGSYWLWLFFAVVISAILLYQVFFSKTEKTDVVKGVLIVVSAFILFIAIFMRPAEVGANTSKDQAARGVYIGY